MRYVLRQCCLAALSLVMGAMVTLPGCGLVNTADPTPTPLAGATAAAWAATANAVVRPPTATTVPSATPSPSPTATVAPTLPSLPVTFENRPLAVMIDNSPSARPHTGLANADLVYEAVVEAGITRLMAVFGRADSTTLGPVRSARHYFVYWAAEHNAVLVHASSSPQGFAAIEKAGLDTIDASSSGGSFWRVDRPHAESWENLYTNTVKDREAAPKGSGRLGAFLFKPARSTPSATPPPAGTPSAAASSAGMATAIGPPSATPTPAAGASSGISVTIAYLSSYGAGYRYDAATNTYPRFINGRPHADEQSGAQYRAANVVIQWMETWPIAGDDAGRMDMKQVGEGRAQYFLDGIAFEGKWRKESIEKPTAFLDQNGVPVQLNRGQTWINVVPDGTKLTVR